MNVLSAIMMIIVSRMIIGMERVETIPITGPMYPKGRF